MNILRNRRILIGVTGSIAAYKSADITSRLIKENAEVKVILTESAEKFITATTLEALSKNHVFSSDSKSSNQDYTHLELAKWADILLIAPATANVINKIANGYGDDLLTTTCLAYNKDLFIAPAMNPEMWNNSITKSNLDKLEKNKIKIIGPDYGTHACGDTGYGRLSSTENIIEKIKGFKSDKILAGLRLLISAGPTREPIDPVRYISNYSSGKMGYSIALVAKQLGATVELVSGPTMLDPIDKIKTTYIDTADEMACVISEKIKNSDVFISTAAISDYRPTNFSETKYKKSEDTLNIEFERGIDIISSVSANNKDVYIVGFAAETHNMLENARKKLKEKNINMIVANKVNHKLKLGFESDYNKVTLITSEYENEFDSGTKLDISYDILKKIHEEYYKKFQLTNHHVEKSQS